jgi:hypothetical protein
VEITLQSLLDEIARDGGDLAALLRQYTDNGDLTAERIAELTTEARAAFEDARGGELNERVIGELETLAAGIQALSAENAHLTEVAEANAARVAEIAAQAGIEPADGDSDAEGEGESGGDVDVANADVVDLTEDGDGGEDATGGETAGAEVEAVAASSAPATRPRRRVSLSDIQRRRQATPPPIESTHTDQPFGGALVAAAGVDGVRSGHQFGSWHDVGQVAANIMDSVGRSGLVASAKEIGRNGGQEFYQRSGLVQLRREYPDDLIVMDDGADSKAILDRAANVARVENPHTGAKGAEALVAATGWCAPSETMYELCELQCALEGILSLPEISAPRGGVRWTMGLDFCDIYNAAGYFHYTEAELMADPAPTKPCMEIPCVEFNECRLEVDGMCITGDIPQARAYPEVVSQFLQGATCARAHRTNAMKIGRIALGSQDDGLITICGGAIASLLGAIDLKIMEYRYRGLRPQDGNRGLLEMVIPFWVRGILRGDLANRRGIADPFNLTDAQINAWFTSRGVIPRWVYDWQPLPAVCANPPEAPITAWPTQVEVIIYEAGTWVLATQDVISIENLYDSTLIRQNKFTALFVEDAWCLLNRCNGSIRFQVPICPSGAVGAEMDCTCGAAPFAPGLVAAEVAGMNNGPQLPDGVEEDPEAEAGLEARKQAALEAAGQGA